MSNQHADNRRGLVTAVVAGAAGAALAAGAIWLAGNASTPATAQGPGQPITRAELDAANLRSQRAIKQGTTAWNLVAKFLAEPNELIRARGPVVLQNRGVGGGLPTPVFADGAITTPKLGDGAVTGSKMSDGSVGESKLTGELAGRIPVWAVVNANGTLARSTPGVTSSRINAGNYRVNFGRDLNLCAFTGTQQNVTVSQLGFIGIQVDGQNANQLFVRTTNRPTTAVNNVSADRSFMVQVTC
jgi:hypothetical protein